MRLAECQSLESLKGHLAGEVVERERSDVELWQAYRRLADCYQSLVLQFEWVRRRQVALLMLVGVGQLVTWGAVGGVLWQLMK